MAMRQPVEWLELRPSDARPVATGTLACPACDLPVALSGTAGLADPIGCAFCGATGAVREFLTLGEPTRPARVVIRVARCRSSSAANGR